MSHWQCICVECEDLRRDAERYRYLRDRAGNGIMDELEAECRPTRWDEIVDEYRGVQLGDGSSLQRSGDDHG